MSCSNPGNNQQLINACACENAANELATTFNQYNIDLQSFNQLNTQYQINYHNYQNALLQWNTNKQNQINSLASEIQMAGCGACGTNPGCPSGWQGLSTQHCGTFNALCNQPCQRTQPQIGIDLGPWLAANPEPISPGPQPIFSEKPPSGINIECCSQLFQNIDASSASFSNIVQQCNQNIQSQIQNSITQSPTSLPPSNTTSSNNTASSNNTPSNTISSNNTASSNNTQYIYYIISILFIIFILFFALIMLFL